MEDLRVKVQMSAALIDEIDHDTGKKITWRSFR
jgi:hypothetical protein